jgi:hypothetical protein
VSTDTPVTASHGRKGRRKRELRLPLTDDRSWNIAEVAYFLNLGETKVRNLESAGQLPALPRIGTRVTFDPPVVRAFRAGWRPPPGWRPTPPSQDFPVDGARRPQR